jgi:hypothetical protein
MRTTTSILAALLIAGFAATATANPPSPNPPDRAFLKSLAKPQVSLPEVGTPGPQWKTCTASLDCGDGNTVACTGDASCHTTFSGVECNGVQHQCPNYCSVGMTCQCCNGSYFLSCGSLRGDCGSSYGGPGIQCDGQSFTCSDSCPFCPDYGGGGGGGGACDCHYGKDMQCPAFCNCCY